MFTYKCIMGRCTQAGLKSQKSTSVNSLKQATGGLRAWDQCLYSGKSQTEFHMNNLCKQVFTLVFNVNCHECITFPQFKIQYKSVVTNMKKQTKANLKVICVTIFVWGLWFKVSCTRSVYLALYQLYFQCFK